MLTMNRGKKKNKNKNKKTKKKKTKLTINQSIVYKICLLFNPNDRDMPSHLDSSE